MKRYLLLVCCILLVMPLSSQHVLSVGAGFEGILTDSKDLDQFQSSYNQVNGPNLLTGFNGFNWTLGVRPEVAYRYFSEWNAGVALGYHRSIEHDFASFTNGESRRLELGIEAFSADVQVGRSWDAYFLNVAYTHYLGRNISIKSTYVPPNTGDEKSLTGTYESPSHSASDIGLVAGVLRKSVLFMARLSFPLYAGSDADVLRESSVEKQSEGLDRFPNDYNGYVAGDGYRGVGSRIAGARLMLTMAYAFRMGE